MYMKRLVTLALGQILAGLCTVSAVMVDHFRCEYLVDPEGVDVVSRA